MAGLDLPAGPRSRRALSSEINMIPMIDLLMVTISFLLLTATWSHMSALPANIADGRTLNGGCRESCNDEPQKTLHVDTSSAESFVLRWKLGDVIIDSLSVPRTSHGPVPNDSASPRFPELAAAIRAEVAKHKIALGPKERPVPAELRVGHRQSYGEVVAALDAIYAARRGEAAGGGPIFAVELSRL